MFNNSFCSARQNAMKKYFSRMNDMQQEAVFSVKGPVLVLAGAGSGKTTVIVNRIANMINFGNAYLDSSSEGSESDIAFLNDYAQGKTDDFDTLREICAVEPINPWNILAITFTNKAAGELKERLSAMLGDVANNIHASTFHSACVRILRVEIDRLGFTGDFTIYDSDDSQRMIKNCMTDLDIPEKQFAPKSVLSEISFAKDRMISPAQLRTEAGADYRKKTIAKLYAVYQERMKTANALDFDDILSYTVELFEKFPEVLEKYQNRYKYIMVDEYQDTNHVQFRLVSLLSKAHGNICVVGDDDQSIYKFRGADIENILGFEKQFEGAKVIRLEQNYRSTKTVLNAANSVISHNNERTEKSLWTDGAEGKKIYWYKAIDDTDEAKFVAKTISELADGTASYSDNAVLYRTNAQSNKVEMELSRLHIPFRVYGSLRFTDRKEVKDLLAYMSFVNNPFDMLRFRRIINEPKRGIGDSTLTLIEEISRDLKISPFDVLKNCEDYAPLAKKIGPLKTASALFEDLRVKSMELTPDKFLDYLIEKIDYMEYVNTLEKPESKIENINTLRENVAEYTKNAFEPTLGGFLEESALLTDADRDDDTDDKVTLMTIHSAKGLEYGNVFVIGMEEGVFPSSRSMDSEKELEEERRLAYVAITRAKNNLYLTSARQRNHYGQTVTNVTSRFIKEIGSELVEKHDNAAYRKIGGENKKVITEVQSMSLQQQLARNKIHASSEKKPSVSYSTGERVSHMIFGEGTIISVTPASNDAMLEVAFDKVGTKKIMANYAKLKKL